MSISVVWVLKWGQIKALGFTSAENNHKAQAPKEIHSREEGSLLLSLGKVQV